MQEITISELLYINHRLEEQYAFDGPLRTLPMRNVIQRYLNQTLISPSFVSELEELGIDVGMYMRGLEKSGCRVKRCTII